ncbi:hypothetical protein [Aurantivibrio plasticivorans]
MFSCWKSIKNTESQTIPDDDPAEENQESRAVAELQRQQNVRMKALVDDLIDRQNKVLDQLQRRASMQQTTSSVGEVGLEDQATVFAAVDAQNLILERMQLAEKNIRAVQNECTSSGDSEDG